MNNLNYTYNAVYLGDKKIIDISNTDTTPDEVDAGNVFYTSDGTPVVGTKDNISSQSDWEQINITTESFIKNKIPLRTTKQDGIIHIDALNVNDDVLRRYATETYGIRSISLNTNTVAGTNGFYISGLTENTIYLTDKPMESIQFNSIGNNRVVTEISKYINTIGFSELSGEIIVVLFENETNKMITLRNTIANVSKNNYSIDVDGIIGLPSETIFKNAYCFFVEHPEIGTANISENIFAGGHNTKALATGSFAFGNNNLSLAQYSVTFGSDGNNYGENSLITGLRNTIYGNNSFSFGSENTIYKKNSLSGGINNVISGENSISIGSNNKSEFFCTSTFGIQTTANADAASSFGIGTISNNEAQFSIGKYNLVEDNVIFAVGIGSSESNRDNIFTIYDNYTGQFNGELEVKEAFIANTTLDVCELGTFYDKLLVKKDIEGEGNLDIHGTASFDQTLAVTGNISGASDLTINKLISGNSLTIENVSKTKTLEVSENTVLGSNTTNTVDIKGSLTVENELTIKGGLTVDKESQVNNNLNILGETKISGKTVISNTAEISSDLYIGGDININGESTVHNLTVSDTLQVENETTFNDDINVNGKIYVNGELINTNTKQSDWSITDDTDSAYIKNKPSNEFYQGDWTEADSNAASYIKNKIPVTATSSSLNIARGKITLTDGTDSVSFTISDLRKLLSLLNNSQGLVEGLSITSKDDIISFSEGVDTSNDNKYN